jgi:hydrogenase-4 component D
METIALTTLLLPFIGALVVSLAPRQTAPMLSTVFALLATIATVALAAGFHAAGSEVVDIPLLSAGQIALFGMTVDKISTLILFVVVFLGLLVALYSTGYLTRGNKEHPHDGSNRYYAFLLIFIGAMSGLVLSSTLLGQLLFLKSPAAAPGRSSAITSPRNPNARR